MLVATIACTALYWLGSVAGKKSALAILVSGSVVLAAVFIFGHEQLVGELNTISEAESVEQLTLSRKAIWEADIQAIRDFGILAGAAKKEIAPIYLPTESFAFMAMARHEAGVRAKALRDDPVWQLYLLSPTAVERFFVEGQQRALLTYAAAGSTVRIEFPENTLEAYAHALAERVH